MADIHIPEPIQPPATPQQRRGLLERLMPLLTLVIAFSAIGLAIWEGLENRRHNRLSVQPRIGADIDAGQDPSTEFVRASIESTGLGPAVINAFRIYFDGVAQDTSDEFGSGRWAAPRAALADGAAAQMNAQTISAGYYLPPGRQMIVFEAMRPLGAAGDSAPPLLSMLDRLAIQICYCSIYDSDCDEITLTTNEPEMQPCPVP